MNEFSTERLNDIKNAIQQMEKYHQIEILRILVENGARVNENKSGIFINMTLLDGIALQKIQKYLDYVCEQNQSLNVVETEKEKYKNAFYGGGGGGGAAPPAERPEN